MSVRLVRLLEIKRRYAILHLEATGMKRGGFWVVLLIFPAILATVAITTTAWAQSEQALYAFKGGPNDGANPFGRPTFDNAGNLYGTTLAGGNTYWAGSVYQLTPSNGG